MTLYRHSLEKVELCGSPFSLFLTYTLTFAGKRRIPTAISINDQTLRCEFSDVAVIEDTFTEQGPLVIIERTWKLNQGGQYRLQASFGYDDAQLENRLFIPAVWYRDNEKGTGCFPSKQKAEYWSFLETRMSIPCCAQLSNGKRLFTCATEPADETRFLASVANERHGMIISIPGSEWPYSYRGKHSLIDTSQDTLPTLLVPDEGLVYHRTFFLCAQEEEQSLSGYCAFVQALPGETTRQHTPLPSWDEWFEYKLTRLINLVKKDEHGRAYLIMGEGNGEVQNVYGFTAASFLVKSLQGAYELARCSTYEPKLAPLRQARKALAKTFGLPDDSLLLASVAKRIGDFFLQAEQSEGVFQDNYDLTNDIWGGYLGIGEHPEFKSMVNSRCNGEAMRSYILLSKQLHAYGMETGSYISLARRVARFYCETQLSSGSFGRWWTEKGKPGDIQGTNGAYIGSFFCTLLPYLDDDDPLKSDLLSAVHQAYSYYSELAFEGAFYGDTLDADSCDKEAGVALLSFFLDLYTLEQDKRQLESATLACQFLVQWIWQRSSFLDAESPLGNLGFSTKGLTSVSVAHHHLDFYGMAIAYEFLRYASFANDPFYREQAVLMLQSCRQLVASEKNPLGRSAAFIGWQPEQLNHTTWEYFDRSELMNGYYDIDIAWVTVLTLGSYGLIKASFPTMLEE
ncbi:hypothetical protein [Sphaerochaeta sp.]|uniref:hypothetical protein n=1 Tax=Sphaerochaeta sp. TaxID=1972642 RepID=UPI002FC69192